MLADIVRIDLGDDERDRRVHAPCGGLVDDDGAPLRRLWREGLARAAARREEDDIRAVEAVGRRLVNGELAAAEVELQSLGAG